MAVKANWALDQSTVLRSSSIDYYGLDLLLVFIAGCQGAAHGLCSLGIGVVVFVEYVGKEEQPEHQKHDCEFYKNQCP